MNKSDKAVDLVDSIFDEGFETYTRIKTAERHVDYLLDMCGPHHRKKLKENMGSLSAAISTGRPYDHPRKLRIRPIVDVEVDEIESDVAECGPVQGEEYPGEFEGASPNDLPEEEPAKEGTPQKKQNKINHVPNQDASGLLTAIKGEMVKEQMEDELNEVVLGSKAARMIKMKTLKIMRRNPGMSMKQAARMAQMS